MSFELKLAFLRELAANHKRAAQAQERLLTHPGDRRAIEELYRFFHNIGGTANAVGLPLLGHFGALCEGLAKLVVDRAVASNELLRLFADGIAGIASVLDDHTITGAPSPPLIVEPQGVTQPHLSGEDRVLSKVLVIDDDPLSAGLIDGCLRSPASCP